MRSPRLISLVAVYSLILMAAPAADAASPRLEISTNSRDTLARTGQLTIRVFATPGTRGARASLEGTRYVKAKRVALPNHSRQRIKLQLTTRGKIAAKACAPLRIALKGRVRARRGSGKVSDSKRFKLPKGCPGTKQNPTAPGAAAPGSPAAPGADPAPPSGGGGGSTPSDPGPVPASDIRAGAARSDITAPVGTPMFAYTARSNLASPPTSFEQALQLIADPAPDRNLYAKTFEASKGIHTRVYARALVLETGGRKHALVMTDLGGVPSSLVDAVLAKVAATGITRDRLMLSATHTHSSTGPIWPADNLGYGVLGGDLFDPRIFEMTANGIAESITQAVANLEPAKVGVGDADLQNASRNREFDPFKRNIEQQGRTEPQQRADSFDPDLNVVRADALDGRPIGVWSNFAVHPTNFGDGNLNFSGDNAATAEREAERAITEDARGRGVAPSAAKPFINVWSNSNQGDISPNGGSDNVDGEQLDYTPTDAAGANMAGKRQARGIVDAWREAGNDMKTEIELDARHTYATFQGQQIDGKQVAFTPVLGVAILAEGNCGPDVNGTGLAGPGHGTKIPLFGAPLIAPQSHPVSVWRIGDFGIVGLPSEITKTMGARIRQGIVAGSGGKLREAALSGLTNGYISYTATPEEYDACTYEGGFTLFGTNQGAVWRQTGKTIAEDLFAGRASAPGIAPPAVGIGTPNTPSISTTPNAGTPVTQPTAAKRYGRATFSWNGGDPSVDAERNEAFVTLERQNGASWDAVGTEEGENDTTELDHATDVWTETWQFGRCDPTGTYRFRVTGKADKGSGVAPYTLTSDTFTVGAMDPITATRTTAGNEVRVTALYPNPGASLLALPRVVRSGTATVEVQRGGNPVEVEATPADGHAYFSAPLQPGDTVTGIESVEDDCGNTDA